MQNNFYAAAASYGMTILLGLWLIPVLHRLKFGQIVRTDGPLRHLEKTGTPTMGGIIFILPIAFCTLLFSGFSKDVLVVIASMICFGAIGFIDDFIKVAKRRSLGLGAKQKLALQLIFSLGLTSYVLTNFKDPYNILMPFSHEMINLGFWYIPITMIIVIMGTVNSVNLADGLDGLVAGVTAILTLMYTIFLVKNGYNTLTVPACAICGACLGFLVFNRHPAKVFMGDTGSLGLGGAIAAIAVLSRSHFYLAVFGIIFVVETLSVILQVISFKTTGKRIFKMSPIHHHFELCGWSEVKVVHTFWAATFIAGIIALLI